MAVYNGEMFIREQIISVLEQLSLSDELLIFDDFSTDTTISIVAEFNDDSRVKFKKNDSKLGVVKNFELALNNAKGNYIFLCDQDDVWLPGKVAECVDALKKNLLVVTDCKVVGHNLDEISPSFFKLRHSGKGIFKNIWKNTYLGCCMAFRRELLDICLPIPAKIPMHDMWLGILAETQGDVLFMPRKLSLYRRHELAVSPAAGKSNLSFFKKVYVRIVLIVCVLNRLYYYNFKNTVKSL